MYRYLRRLRREARGALVFWGLMPFILHLGKFYPPAPGGIETHLRTLALSQAMLGAKVSVLCVNHADVDGNDATWRWFRATPTIEEFDGPVRILRIGKVSSLARWDVCPILLRELRRLLGLKPDVIHLQTPNPTMLLALAAVGCRAPIVVTHHSDIVRQRLLKYALAPFERLIYSRAGCILSDSPLYLGGSAVLARYREKVVTLPLGIDLNPYLDPSAAALRHARELREAHGQPLWLMVGRLIYYKGIEVALKALRSAPGRLLIVGTGPLQESLKRLAGSLGVADRVHWQGHTDPETLTGAFMAATALWFPSVARSEAFGLVQVEAMASGCPVINTAIPHSGVSWVSPHEESGLTVPVGDPDALAAAALRLWREPDLRERLGQQGRRRAISSFSQECMAQRSLEIYRSLRKPA
jgi:glycosyltransferase involved in cell wall biosynthesis